MPMMYPSSREEWLKIRHGMVSSTEVAALFGMGSYLTEFELYHIKRETIIVEWEPNERTTWGTRLQDSVAKGIAEDYGVKVRRINGYMVHNQQPRMGASFDYEIVGLKDVVTAADATPERPVTTFEPENALRIAYKTLGAGVLEIKCVDWLVFRDKWNEEDGMIEAPPQIELQVQHQLECIDRAWSCIGVLIGGNANKIILRERDTDVGQAIVGKVAEFWRMVETNTAPPPVLPVDAAIIRQLYLHAEPGRTADLQADEEAKVLAETYQQAKARIKEYEASADEAQAKLFLKFGNAEVALLPEGLKISAGTVAGCTFTVNRKPYRSFRITKVADKPAKKGKK